MTSRRIAAIDVGTNSIHMIMVEQQKHGYRVIDKEKDMVQLGRGSLEGRPLTDDAVERGVEALKRMAGIAERWKVDEVVAVATSAIREAPNGRRFITAAQKAVGDQDPRHLRRGGGGLHLPRRPLCDRFPRRHRRWSSTSAAAAWS